MLKRTITYKDYNDNERTEDFYFNLTEAEVSEMELGTTGGFVAMMKTIIAAQDSATIIKVFKELLLKSYGEKSLDGKYFHKSKEIAENFSHTEAYSILYMELSTDADKASAFFKNVIPANLKGGASKAIS